LTILLDSNSSFSHTLIYEDFFFHRLSTYFYIARLSKYSAPNDISLYHLKSYYLCEGE
jgi:hypothetical protein